MVHCTSSLDFVEVHIQYIDWVQMDQAPSEEPSAPGAESPAATGHQPMGPENRWESRPNLQSPAATADQSSWCRGSSEETLENPDLLKDPQSVQNNMCDYYESGYSYGNYYSQVPCRSSNRTCYLKVWANTCYCCNLYNCNRYYLYYMFIGVNSCWDVVHMYRLLWSSVVLNVAAIFLGITDAALLRAYNKLEKKSRNIPLSPVPPPHILYNPTQHNFTDASFCPPQAPPAYPNYPIPNPVSPCTGTTAKVDY
ncbi:hypothetical protein WMY93_019166 [Mugilogobius chulae]|uniref:Uncharacterized protein n=1 Tax=Mugilogobius chulae TaxID=88201 RepID=A0AAW0NES7_9GOBI